MTCSGYRGVFRVKEQRVCTHGLAGKSALRVKGNHDMVLTVHSRLLVLSQDRGEAQG